MARKSEDAAAVRANEIMEKRISEEMVSSDIKTISAKEIRNMRIDSNAEFGIVVDRLDQAMHNRIDAGNQYRAYLYECCKNEMPEEEIGGDILLKIFLNFKSIEEDLNKIITATLSNPNFKDHKIAQWLLSIPGIGPKHAAVLISKFDIEKAPTAGHFWSYIGWTGEPKYRKRGEKITWNPELRSRCYLISDSFIKTKSRPQDVYGHIYQAQKDKYLQKNEEGGFAEAAKNSLEREKAKKNPSKEVMKANEEGKLTLLHIDNMARRYAVKLFLAHFHDVWYYTHFNTLPPNPYPIVHLGHAHVIEPPNLDVVGIDKLY